MADWAWPHTPGSNWARLRLEGGPFAGTEVAFLQPDAPAPAQIVWSGWLPWGFAAYLYEWHGEGVVDQGRTETLVYRATGRRLAADEMPPIVGQDVDVWADAAVSIARAHGVPAEMLWHGL